MSPEIGRLKQVLDCCRAGKPLPAAVAAWLGMALRNYISQRSATLEEALGLRATRGGVPWRRAISIRERDAALQCLARTFFASVPIYRQAVLIQNLARRYAGANWPLDRASDLMPSRYTGTPNALLWQAFVSGAPMPLGARRLQTILAKRDGCGVAARADSRLQEGPQGIGVPDLHAQTGRTQPGL